MTGDCPGVSLRHGRTDHHSAQASVRILAKDTQGRKGAITRKGDGPWNLTPEDTHFNRKRSPQSPVPSRNPTHPRARGSLCLEPSAVVS